MVVVECKSPMVSVSISGGGVQGPVPTVAETARGERNTAEHDTD